MPGGTESYTLDPLNRLTGVTYANGDSAGYTYDANGNRVSETFNSVTTNYTYDDAGQLLTDGNINFTYDANGNLTVAGADIYTWDWADRLVAATVAGNAVSYSYDAFDVRVGATVNGAASNYLWDRQATYPLLVDDGSTAYLHNNGPLAQIDSGGNRHYLLTDALHSVRGLVDGAGALVGTTEYAAFGALRNQSGMTSSMGFTGELFSPATGLLHLRARDLLPNLGRFLSADTVQPNAPGTMGYNLYAYAANNPTTWADPSGHFVAPALPVLGGLCTVGGIGCLFLMILLLILFLMWYIQWLQFVRDQTGPFAPDFADDLGDIIQDWLDNGGERDPLPTPIPVPVPVPVPTPVPTPDGENPECSPDTTYLTNRATFINGLHPAPQARDFRPVAVLRIERVTGECIDIVGSGPDYMADYQRAALHTRDVVPPNGLFPIEEAVDADLDDYFSHAEVKAFRHADQLKMGRPATKRYIAIGVSHYICTGCIGIISQKGGTIVPPGKAAVWN